jgi:hypothetical protein
MTQCLHSSELPSQVPRRFEQHRGKHFHDPGYTGSASHASMRKLLHDLAAWVPRWLRCTPRDVAAGALNKLLAPKSRKVVQSYQI